LFAVGFYTKEAVFIFMFSYKKYILVSNELNFAEFSRLRRVLKINKILFLPQITAGFTAQCKG